MSGGPYDIVLAGRGGQGVLFLARVLGEAALRQGLPVRVTETHGMAMRGGSVLCFVRLGPCMGPLFPRGTASLLMALHPSEVPMGMPFLDAAGTVAVNGAAVAPDPVTAPRTVRIEADRLAADAGNQRSANLALLGAVSARAGGFPLSVASLEAAIMGTGPERLRTGNLNVFHLGLGI